MTPVKKAQIIAELQGSILRMQGFKPLTNTTVDPGLGPILDSFPNKAFPIGAIHEFLFQNAEGAAATTGFITGLMSSLMRFHGAALWISRRHTIFPPAMKAFGIQPDRFIFVELEKDSDILWAIDEALKCKALTAVIAEIKDLNFSQSRRLQLAVEESKITGFILRNEGGRIGTTACVSRWKITPVQSEPVDGLPGIGFPQWQVELVRVRNGRPGNWTVRWENNRFEPVLKDSGVDGTSVSISGVKRKAG